MTSRRVREHGTNKSTREAAQQASDLFSYDRSGLTRLKRAIPSSSKRPWGLWSKTKAFIRASLGPLRQEIWLVLQVPAAEDAVETAGEVAVAEEVVAEVPVPLFQGRHQKLGPARNLKAIFLPLAQKTRARMVT